MEERVRLRVLVTGGAGFVGSHVAEYYASKGEKVTVLDDLSRFESLGKSLGDPHYNWNYLKGKSNVQMVKGSVTRFEDVRKNCADVDVIVHTAAQVAVTASLTNPRTDFEINALGTFNVLEAARLNDAMVIYTSTNKVYGENVNKIPVEELATRYRFSDPKYKNGIPESLSIDDTAHSPYGCSKLTGDLYAQDYAETYGLRTGVFRMSCIYGPRQFGVEDQGWIAWFTIATLTGRPITIYGDGKQVRDVLFISDLVEAFDAFLRSTIPHGEVFNIGGGAGNTLSLLELLDMLKDITGKENKVIYANWRPSDQKVYISNISRARKNLSWNPKIGPKDGVKQLVKWVSANKKLFT